MLGVDSRLADQTERRCCFLSRLQMIHVQLRSIALNQMFGGVRLTTGFGLSCKPAGHLHSLLLTEQWTKQYEHQGKQERRSDPQPTGPNKPTRERICANWPTITLGRSGPTAIARLMSLEDETKTREAKAIGRARAHEREGSKKGTSKAQSDMKK